MTAKMGTREFTRISIMREIAHLPECRRRASSPQSAQPPGLRRRLTKSMDAGGPGTPCLGADTPSARNDAAAALAYRAPSIHRDAAGWYPQRPRSGRSRPEPQRRGDPRAEADDPGATPATLSHRHSKPGRGFGPSSSGAISPQCRRAMAEDRDRTSPDPVAPAPGNDLAEV